MKLNDFYVTDDIFFPYTIGLIVLSITFWLLYNFRNISFLL